MEVGCSAPEVEVAWKGNTNGHEVRRPSAMVRSLRELEWREEKGGERGSLDEEACERPCPKRRKRRGPVRGRGRESRADRVREKERKRTVRVNKANAA